MNQCYNCGNCQQDSGLYYCTASNEFIIKEGVVVEKDRSNSGWKKGDPEYERHRRKIRQGEDLQNIG
jgi:hypothetical protein